MRAEDADLAAALAGIEALDADILLLTDIDYDHGLAALSALNDRLAEPYPHLFARLPNTGMPTGRDLDGNGALAEPRDAQGYGWYGGEGGMAVLSRLPLSLIWEGSAMLWQDVPDTRMPPDDPGRGIQRLSTAAHWMLRAGDGAEALTLMMFHATPPVFDGPEDRNGARNHDEIMLWRHLLDGRLPVAPPEGRFVVLGHANLDPVRGAGRRQAISALLDDPRLRDPHPGAPTSLWPETLGALRLSYVLPSRDLVLQGAGLRPPAEATGPHGAVWIDVAPPDPPG
ncbi:Endonuclease/Exonuclease/phosphatase family protein [Roseivivax lentus]|uniref:Endonuclease/Exonuclease/phosphatase family protein n=1 Tax=Roseivivax lentus TaxID=633194 RepID=A0A1N7JV31_9RHOB|nr:endonuclease/exonuclease/phosphatase family protein [Roseivivax lentus]SIS53222.1 Endonuclease/Exonuclease/phosphatase family protein [Roseivivax lentus]